MNHSTPGQPSEAILARTAAADERGRKTHQAIVVKSDHERCAFRPCCESDGRGEHGKEIVAVNNVGSVLSNPRTNLPYSLRRPDGPSGQANKIEPFAYIRRRRPRVDLVPVSPQEFGLVLDHAVLAGYVPGQVPRVQD